MNRYLFCLLFCVSIAAPAADLTGNWLAEKPRPDGTVWRAYLDLKQEGSRVTGHVRTSDFFYTVSESAQEDDGWFKLTAFRVDGDKKHEAIFRTKLIGADALSLIARKSAWIDQPTMELSARRIAAGEGAMPAVTPPPALHRVRANGLAQTPPMGWNSWNKFKAGVDDDGVRAAADAMVATGMKNAGYLYVNIDDTWQGERDAQGEIHPNKKFPDMKALADYVHSKGLKLGIYSSPGLSTCGGYPGSYGHEEQDARTYSAWGIDYLKYDWCSAGNLYLDRDMQGVYQKMGDALLATGRPIVYSLCQYGRNEVWKWGPEVGANLWRTTNDIRDSWKSMSAIGFEQGALAQYAAPGQWNDPDMLEIGNGGMSAVEYRTHMSLWSMLAAPLLAGNDLQHASAEILAILTNREVIAIDQDPKAKQARRALQSGDYEVWTRDLSGGAKAIAIFNRGASDGAFSFNWSDIGFAAAPTTAREAWLHRDISLSGASHRVDVPSHGVVLLVTPAAGGRTRTPLGL